jgi:hypothetical protein
MPPVVLIGLVAVAIGLVLFSGPAAGGPRTYTRADLPKLRELMLRKAGIGRELKICLQKETEHSLFSAQQFISFGVGLFTGVATLNPDAAIKAARATDAAITKLGGKKAPACQAEIALTQQQLAQHDQVSKELGLSPDMTYVQLQALVKSLGGFNPIAGEVEDDFTDMDSTNNTWNRCVNGSGVTVCETAWKAEGNVIPPHDPKTGLATRRR